MELAGVPTGRPAPDLTSRFAGQPSSAWPPTVAETPSPGVVAARSAQRIAFLDVAKGIGILLVVVGHALRGLHDAGIVAPGSGAWLLYYLIYCFHMPMFFFLSGSLVERRITTRPGRFLHSTVTRIAYPYFLWAGITTAAMLLMSGMINHQLLHPPVQDFVDMLWQPPGPFWFLYVLFFLHLTALLTLRLGGKLLMVAVCAALYLVSAVWQPAADFLSSYVAGTNILFYLLGVCAGSAMVNWRGRIAQPYLAAAVALVVFFASAWTGWTTQAPWYSYITLPAAFAATAVVLLLSKSSALNDSRWLTYLGRRAISIYVMHVLFVAGTRILLVNGLHVTSPAIILPVIIVIGVVMPLIIDRIARILRIQPVLGLV